MADYTPSSGAGAGEALTYMAGATITGGQLLAFTGPDTVQPTSGPTLAWAGVAGHDAAPGQPVTVHAGAGVMHHTGTPAALAAPAAPAPATAATGGTVADGVYKVAVTYVNAAGETAGSAQGTVTTAGGGLSTLTVPSPGAQAGATGWYAYVSQPGGNTLTRQQGGAATAIGTPLVLTAPPTSGGAQPPAGNTTQPGPGSLVGAAAGGLVAGGAAAGSELGIAARAVTSAGLITWKTTRG